MRSGIWVGISEAGLALLGIVRSVALARLLTPEMFGLMALAMIVVRAIETFTRPGVSQALIARQRPFEEASPTAFTMLIIRGGLLALLLAIAAPWIGRFYDSPDLGSMLQALAIVFAISGFNNINIVAQQRELDFRKLTYLSQVTNVIGTLVTIVSAWLLRNVWALVIGQVLQATLNMLLSYYFVPGRPKFGFDRTIAADLMRYGKYITGSSIVLYIATEIDSAVIGKVLGPAEVGYYTIAFTIAYLATTNLSKVASNIMMPAYSKLQNDLPALRAAFLRTLGLLLYAVLPATLGIMVLAEPLITVVYGERWVAAAVPLQILALFGLFRAMAAFSGYLFEGMGQPGISFRLGLVRLAIILPIVWPMTVSLGFFGTAITVTLGIAAQWLGGLWYLKRVLGVGPGALARAMWRPLWTSIAMGCAVFALARWGVDALHVFGLVAAVACGVVLYVILNLRVLLDFKRERFA